MGIQKHTTHKSESGFTLIELLLYIPHSEYLLESKKPLLFFYTLFRGLS